MIIRKPWTLLYAHKAARRPVYTNERKHGCRCRRKCEKNQCGMFLFPCACFVLAFALALQILVEIEVRQPQMQTHTTCIACVPSLCVCVCVCVCVCPRVCVSSVTKPSMLNTSLSFKR